MKNIKVSKTFSILIIVIITGIFLFPNILLSLQLHLFEEAEKTRIEHLNAAIQSRDMLLTKQLNELGVTDKGFYLCIRNEIARYMGLSPDQSLGSDLRKYVTSLHCKNMGVRNINGAEKLTGLKYLDLSGNPIIDISPLTHLDSLVSIDLSGVKLMDHKALFSLSALTSIYPPDFSSVYCEDIKYWANTLTPDRKSVV